MVSQDACALVAEGVQRGSTQWIVARRLQRRLCTSRVATVIALAIHDGGSQRAVPLSPKALKPMAQQLPTVTSEVEHSIVKCQAACALDQRGADW